MSETGNPGNPVGPAPGGNDAGTRRRTLTGTVVSDCMDKTVTVLVRRRFRHRVYAKYVTRTTRIKAHDEDNECRVGDVVAITSCRRLSKSKSWRLSEVVARAQDRGRAT